MKLASTSGLHSGTMEYKCRNGNCLVGDGTAALEYELPSLPVDPGRGGVRLACERQVKIHRSPLGKGEILRRLSGGFVCARPPFGSAELYVESHVLMNSFKLGSTAHFEDLKKYKIAYFVD